ncbi:CubicO group peptidase, beta-lactamase class C family [Actinacidiphila yanglinensis]|uniref:CubicO group peptidase, beta-lactamase class C family n=1 Tax=Actinacidiphila yanglinensis TaxID=310779 RepID=A0A1H5ZFK6_9ACTN|nr:serine hydrolase domain-containing protein [Actinacidiphila yanglinensis]SEG35062.1 CubicO group peptidase, beta-lactamase class C family [Actinacidiphila yanglinensis]
MSEVGAGEPDGAEPSKDAGGVEVHGRVADGWEPVRDAFVANFARRGDVGAAVALHHDGRAVVDLWAGRSGYDGGGPWERGTAQVVRSAGKGVAAVCLLLLHQRGQLDLDAPVSAYWPEFKAHGKDRVTVRDVLAHRAGVPALDIPLTPEQAVDGTSGPRAVAAQAPLFAPGQEHGYHAQTFSWLVGELVLRASGRTVGRFVAEEIARPLGLDLWLGLPADQAHRVGRIGAVTTPEPPASGGLRARAKRTVQDAYADPTSLTSRAFAAITPLPDENDPGYRAGQLAASGTIATARSLSRCYAALIGDLDEEDAEGAVGDVGAEAGGSGGGVGRRLFAPATLAAARTVEADGPDRVLVVNTCFGLGYMLHGPSAPLLGPGSFGHPGRGGSLAFADPENGIGFGYVTNALQRNVTADPRAQALVRAVRQCLA